MARGLFGFGFDTTPARREALRTQAERALKLAPESESSQFAYAAMQLRLGQDAAGEQILRRLLERNPRHWRAQLELAAMYGDARRVPEAERLLQSARQSSDEHPEVIGNLLTLLTAEHRFAEAEQVAATSLARQPTGRVLEFDAKWKLIWRANPASAAAAVSRWPAWMFNEDRGAQAAAEIWMFNREPARALDVLTRFSRDYIRHSRFFGPKAALTAWLHEQAGNAQAAKSDWQTAIQIADRELAASPGSTDALHWKA